MPLTARLKRHSIPIAAAVTATLVLSVTFSIFYSGLASYTSPLPLIPMGTSTGDNQLWKFTPNGSIYDPPVVLGHYVFVQSYNRSAGVRYVYCLDSSSGIQIWSHTTDRLAVINGNNVYIKSASSNVMYALDAATGSQRWNYTSRDGMTPRVATDGTLFLSTGDISEGFFVYALDASTGIELWNYKVPEYVQAIDVANGYVFVSFNDVTLHGDMIGYIYALDAVKGTKIWNYTVPIEGVNGIIIDRLLYVGTGGSNIYVLDPSNGQKLGNYTTEEFGAIPLAYGNFVYARTANRAYALDASTLEEKWSLNFQGTLDRIVPNSPNIYFGAGTVIHSIDAASGESKWAVDVQQNSIYTVKGNQAYIATFYPINSTFPFLVPSTQSNVYVLDALSGTELVDYTVEGNAMALEEDGNILYVATAFATTESTATEGNGALYAIEVPSQTPTPSPPASVLSSSQLLLGVVGSLYPALSTARTRPSEAMKYE